MSGDSKSSVKWKTTTKENSIKIKLCKIELNFMITIEKKSNTAYIYNVERQFNKTIKN